MFIIWGSRQSNKTLSSHGNYCCENCNNTRPFDFVKYSTWFTLFFIPVFPYSSKHYLLCPVCQYGYELNKKQIAELQKESDQKNNVF